MSLPDMINVKAFEWSEKGIREIEVPVSAEYPITLKINNNPFVSIACSGRDLETLAAGHLVSEGIIESYDEIEKIEIDEKELNINISVKITEKILDRLFRIRSIASGCGQGGSEIIKKETDILKGSVLPAFDINGFLSTMKKFLQSSAQHKLTRGVHSAALYDFYWHEYIFYDEIGRHNAIDKIIGNILMRRIPVNDKIIFSTGRLSSEIILKAVNMTIPAIASKASPTTLSVELAKKYNLLLLGKVSAKRFCIFNGIEIFQKAGN